MCNLRRNKDMSCPFQYKSKATFMFSLFSLSNTKGIICLIHEMECSQAIIERRVKYYQLVLVNVSYNYS